MAKFGQVTNVSGQPMRAIEVTAEQTSSYSMLQAKRPVANTVVAWYRDLKAAKNVEIVIGEGEPVIQFIHPYGSEAEAKNAATAEFNEDLV